MSDTSPASGQITYRDAGVDIDAGDALVTRIADDVASTRRAEVLGGLGGFGGLFALPPGRWREPVLVAGTDGVGTKLKLAGQLGRHDGIGTDLVAMCVNDVIVTGAEPLFFLDYYATGRLDVDTAATVIRGIAAGCRQAGCALIGGETAEMPGMYTPGEYDLAGFCVGGVERSDILTPERVTVGDAVVGIASSGPHANGYSLIRRLLESRDADPAQPCGDNSLGEALLAPTRIYVRAVRALLETVPVHALAHITGGGLPENLPRVLPTGMRAVLDASAWPRPPVFDWLAGDGEVAPHEMLRTFNCGVGMAVVMPADATESALAALDAAGESAWIIGRIETGEGAAEVRIEAAG